MPAAEDDRVEPHARVHRAHEERAHALRPAQLVRREGDEVEAERVDVERDLAERLDGVRVEEDAPLLAEARDLRRRD